jgi:hypothetical protein
MSVYISAAVWKMQLQPTNKLIMLALADMANDEGQCWPSNRSLQRRTGLSERTVRGALTDLEEQGLVRRDSRFNEGRQTSNLFEILVNEGGSICRGGGQQLPGEGAGDAGGRGQEMPPRKRTEGNVQETSREPMPVPVPVQAEVQFFDHDPGSPFGAMKEIWNRTVRSLPKITRITGARARLASARFKDLGDIWSFEEFCKTVEASDFLTARAGGRDQRKWTECNFDWCMKPSNFDKIREGRYNNKPKSDEPNTKPTFW